MASAIFLPPAIRSNLFALQTASDQVSLTQARLSTGRKVNSALDNPTSFFTAAALDSRARDLTRVLDGISHGVQALRAAETGIESLMKLVDTTRAAAHEALRAEKARPRRTPDAREQRAEVTSAAMAGLTADDLLAGRVLETKVTGTKDLRGVAAFSGNGPNSRKLSLNAHDIWVNKGETGEQVVDRINAAAADTGVSAQLDSTTGQLALTSLDPQSAFTIGGHTQLLDGLGLAAGTTSPSYTGGAANSLAGLTLELTPDGGATGATVTFGTRAGEVSTLQELNATLRGVGFEASLAGETLTIRTAVPTITTFTLTGTATDPGEAFHGREVIPAVSGSDAAGQGPAFLQHYAALRDQIGRLALDASYNGVNLLAGDQLTFAVNEDGTALRIGGTRLNAQSLGLSPLQAGEFGANAIEAVLGTLDSAAQTLRSEASRLATSLSMVETRRAFAQKLVNTLTSGAANLTLADTDEVGANLLALKTREQFSTMALSFGVRAAQRNMALL